MNSVQGDDPSQPDDQRIEGLLEILAATSDFVTSRDHDGRLVYMNPTARRWLGLPPAGDSLPGGVADLPEELQDLDTALARAHPPWALRRLREEAIPTAQHCGIWQGETAVLDAEGREVPVSQVLIVHRATTDSPGRISTIMRDISAAKELERRLREERDFQECIFDALPNLFVLLDDDNRIQRHNEEFGRRFVTAGTDIAGTPLLDILPLDCRERVGNWLGAIRESGSAELDVALSERSGHRRWFAMRGVRMDTGAGLCLSLIGTDITKRREAEAREKRRNRILTLLARDEPLADILELITGSVEAEAPDSLCSILLLDEDRQCLRHGAAPNLPKFFVDAIDGVVIGDAVGSCGTAAWRNECVIVEDIRSDPLWHGYREICDQAGLLACWSHPIRTATGRVLGTFAIYHRQPRRPGPEDVERIERAADLASLAIERKRLSDALEYQATHDALTGLSNRRQIEQRLQDEIRRAERYGRPFSLIMLDIDRFKPINDQFGHDIGDAVLHRLAREIESNIRATDVCGRWGGEEFLLILQETRGGDALKVAEALRRHLTQISFPPIDHITVSMGVCEYERGEGRDRILKRVDAALYRAKDRGRNRTES